MRTLQTSLLALCAVMLAASPALAWRGGGFGGFRGGGGFGGFRGGDFGGFHRDYGSVDAVRGPYGGGAAVARGPDGGEAAAVRGPEGVWHAGGVNAYGGTWHAEGYHPDGYWGGGYGYHAPAVVNSYYGGGCWNCGAGLAAGAIAGAAVVGAAASAAATTAALGSMVVTLPPGCDYRTVGPTGYYVCGPTWYQPFYGNNGVYYRVVPPL